MPLYARVDGVVRDREQGSQLIVIEVEALEPALFMEFDPVSAERFAEETLRRLQGRLVGVGLDRPGLGRL